jgi:hypothetical protein
MVHFLSFLKGFLTSCRGCLKTSVAEYVKPIICNMSSYHFHVNVVSLLNSMGVFYLNFEYNFLLNTAFLCKTGILMI